MLTWISKGYIHKQSRHRLLRLPIHTELKFMSSWFDVIKQSAVMGEQGACTAGQSTLIGGSHYAAHHRSLYRCHHALIKPHLYTPPPPVGNSDMQKEMKR